MWLAIADPQLKMPALGLLILGAEVLCVVMSSALGALFVWIYLIVFAPTGTIVYLGLNSYLAWYRGPTAREAVGVRAAKILDPGRECATPGVGWGNVADRPKQTALARNICRQPSAVGLYREAQAASMPQTTPMLGWRARVFARRYSRSSGYSRSPP